MVFKDLTTIWRQPQPDQCVPTAIKIVLTSQFHKINIPSVKEISRMCQYKNTYGVPIDNLKINLKQLERIGIQFNEKENANIDFLEGLLNENGCFPLILFHLTDYNKWKKKTSIEIDDDDKLTFHMVIVVGVDKTREEVKIFDTINDKYKNYTDFNKYDIIKYQKLYALWTSKDLLYPVFWFNKMLDLNNKGQTRLKI